MGRKNYRTLCQRARESFSGKFTVFGLPDEEKCEFLLIMEVRYHWRKTPSQIKNYLYDTFAQTGWIDKQNLEST
jgi:hypothetical protein